MKEPEDIVARVENVANQLSTKHEWISNKLLYWIEEQLESGLDEDQTITKFYKHKGEDN